ncbi:MAG: glycosyltransferase family 2 protein [Nitrospinota bacterium]|nr:glycosyltransferase family 2 protein [Nitrospinota bacterium]
MTNDLNSIIAIVPAYNPNEKLLDVVEGLVARGIINIVVVDDGTNGASSINIIETVHARPEVTVVRHAINRGKGAALKTGFNHVLLGYDRISGILTIDADGQHLPDDAVTLANSFMENSEALCIGARDFDRDVPWKSRFGNQMTRWVFLGFVGRLLKDTQSGLRVITPEFARQMLTSQSDGYEFELDMLIQAVHSGVPIREIPITTIYENQNRGTHFNPLWDSLKIYYVFLRFVLASLVTSLADMALFSYSYYLYGSVLGSIIAGRVIIGALNFIIVKMAVFKSDESIFPELIKYTILTMVVMILSYMSIIALNKYMGVNIYLSKILAEGVLFFMSFTVQRVLIFYNNKR